jgi:glutathione synthase
MLLIYSMEKGFSFFFFDQFRDTILFVVQEKERNIGDQKHLEHVLWEKYNVPTLRLTHHQVYSECELKGNDLYHEGKCVSVVYFRSGYTPKDYPGEEQWKARFMIERSSAIKCPSIVN